VSLNRATLSLAFVAIVVAMFSVSAVAADQQAQDAAIYYDQGIAFLKADKIDEALKAFKEAIKLKPDYAEAYIGLGDAYSQRNDLSNGVEAYKQAVRYQPDSAVAHSKLAKAYSGTGDLKEAGASYIQAIRLNPKSPDLHYQLGTIYTYQKKEKEALAEYQILQTLDPSLAQDLYNFIYQPTVGFVTADTVRLNVIATDSSGKPVSGLTAEDFQVVENGLAQKVSVATNLDAGALIGVAIDTSGSIRPAFPLAIASTKFIILKSGPIDQTLLIRFVSSDKIETLQDFTADKTVLVKAVDTLYIEAGQSAIIDAVYLAAQRLGSYKFPDHSRRRILILLSDGEDRASYYSSETLLKLLQKTDLQIFPISLSIDERRGRRLNDREVPKSADLLRRLASATGGKVFFPKSTDELEAAINQILDVLRVQYTLEYKPTKPIEPGVYRPVTITVRPAPGRENWTVTSRSGYVFSPK
jgi:Ca-activated chloride channel family protein